MQFAVITYMGGHFMQQAAAAPWTSTGGDEPVDEVGAPDSAWRRLLAYMLVKVAYYAFRATMRLLPRDHPFRIAFESAIVRMWGVASQHPRLGILPMGGGFRPLSPTTVRLWKVAITLTVFLLVSDTFAFGPIDLGLIPNVHIGLASALHLPWANDPGPHLFAYDLHP